MTDKTIAAENLGPIEQLTVQLRNYGLTVLSAPNGSGKSIFLDAAAKLAKGGGKVPLRDHARKGKVDGFGATITIGRSSRYAGEFEVQSLEGRFDLAELVDPKLKSPTAADTRRIKALVGLTGVKADPDLFAKHDSFFDFGDVVPAEVAEYTDLVEMAGYIKRQYEQEARQAEKAADTEFGEANACKQMAGEYDEELASADPDVLSAKLQDALQEKTRMRCAVDEYQTAAQRHEKAAGRLQALCDEYDGPDVSAAQAASEEAHEAVIEQQARIEALEKQIRHEQSTLVSLEARHEQQIAALREAERHEQQMAEYRKILDTVVPEAPDAAVVEAVEAAVQDAQQLVEAAAVARKAFHEDVQAREHKQLALKFRQKAERLREAAKSTDEVLSAALTCKVLRVESTGGETRLVVDHPRRGNSVPFHELSEGERWRIAIELGAEQVGEGGLLVLPQEAFESLDSWVRDEIHAAAVDQKVYILTAQATRDKSDGEQLVVKEYSASTGAA